MLGIVETENQTKKIAAIAGSAQGSGIPVGSVIAMYASRAPSDAWLLCDGSTFDPSKYPALAMYLGTNKVPDLRECVLVGAGESDNDYDATDNPNGIHEHDVYDVGEFKDDQLQDHSHAVENTYRSGGDMIVTALSTVPDKSSSGISSYTALIPSNAGYRIGSTTHGKQFGLNYFIKATSSSDDSDYQGTLAQIREYAKTAGSPLGTWQSFEGGVAPNDDWLEAGSTFNADDYPALAMMLGETTVPERFDHSRLGESENITFTNNSFTADYDGVMSVCESGQYQVKFYVNGELLYHLDNYNGFWQNLTIPFKKGDVISYDNSLGNPTIKARFYKTHLFIKGVPNSSDKDFQGTLMEIRQYSRNQGCPLGTWMAFENDQAPSDAWLAAGTIFDPDKYPALAMMLGTNKVPERFDHTKLSDWEQLNIQTNEYECPYDGFVCFGASGNHGANTQVFVNGITAFSVYTASASNGFAPIPVHKGDKITGTKISLSFTTLVSVSWYKSPLFIKAFPTSDDSDYQGTLATIKKYINDQNELSDWEDITLSNNSSNPTEMPYDGFIFAYGKEAGQIMIQNSEGTMVAGAYTNWPGGPIWPVKKGESYYYSTAHNVQFQGCRARYYKKRDYSNR